MQISNNISFGKKIKIAQCQVQNKETKEFIPATIYEYDCKDKSDAEKIAQIPGYWTFKQELYYIVKDKCRKPSSSPNSKLYSLETEKGNTLGLMMFSHDGQNNDVEILETKYLSGHKYVGSSLLTAAAKNTLKNNYAKLTVSSPLREAEDFYKEACGFEETYEGKLELNRSKLAQFISLTEGKTKAKMIDFKI